MRGVWSTLDHGPRPGGARRLHLLRRLQAGSEAVPPRRSRSRSVQADDIEEVQIKSADGETTRLQKADGKWQLVEPVQAAADTSELTTIASSLVVARNSARRRRERVRSQAIRARTSSYRDRVPAKGTEGSQASADRGEDTDRQRSLRAFSRSEARVPGVVLSRQHVQQEHVRPARPPHPGLRSQHGGWTGSDERHVEDEPRQERFRVETRIAHLGARGLRSRRRRTRAALLHADAGHRRCRGQGPGEVSD